MSGNNPYRSLPDTAYWKRSVAGVIPEILDPVVDFPFKIDPGAPIVTAGSCFAGHLANRLQIMGFNHYITEDAPFFMDDEMAQYNQYGVFAARYGNVYTCQQLLQLFERAYGEFIPDESVWEYEGGWVDPFRPGIQRGGFASPAECLIDREQHFEAVRSAFENLDVFVFTLGLTESWVAKKDGAVFPLCPGVTGGVFDDSRYQFRNFDVHENTASLMQFIDKLRQVNADARVILTVSPVPLVATYEQQHVLLSTTYSKSVMRVVCEEVVKASHQVAYFPSYEIITGSYTRGQYFEDDLRSVSAEGVDHVMRCFMNNCVSTDPRDGIPISQVETVPYVATERMLDVLCDEEALDNMVFLQANLSKSK